MFARSLLLAVIFAGASHISCFAGELRDGDIIFQSLPSEQSPAIAAATHSRYTHVGLVLFEEGEPYVYEAVQPVRKSPLVDWIARGEDGHYVIKRLKSGPLERLSTPSLKKEASALLGKDYDTLFDWSDDRIYCSEYVWKVYERAMGVELCPLRRFKDFDLSDNAVQELIRKRYGGSVPHDMKVVAPSDIFDSKLLRTVAQE